MNKTHDALRQLEYIQQTLSQNTRPTGFFIGAGCPLSVRVKDEKGAEDDTKPLIQDIAGLTKAVDDQLKSKNGEEDTAWDRVVKVLNDDNKKTPNIESILSFIRMLSSVAGKGEVRGFNAKILKKLDEQICKTISEEVNKTLPNTETPYHNLAIWTRSVNRDHPVHIFTTNYDMLLEQAFEESLAPYFDGFVGARQAFFDLGAVESEQLLPARWSRLWKIHGSINWRLDSNKNVVRSEESGEGLSYLIYPSHLKYDQSRKMPYLAMLDRLKEFLLKPSSVLFICGYSFSDDHVNDLICRTLASNSTATVFALLHGSLDQAKYAEAKNCANSTPSLSIMAFDKAIIGRLEADWALIGQQDRYLSSDVVAALSDDKDGEVQKCEVKLGDFKSLSAVLRTLSHGVGDDDE